MSSKTKPTANTINITFCDNEIIILAYQATATLQDSFELCRIKNGFNNQLDVTIDLSEGTAFSGTVEFNGVVNPINTPPTVQQSLPSGLYQLLILGINWGGGQGYIVTVNGTEYGLYYTPGQSGLAYFSPPIDITV